MTDIVDELRARALQGRFNLEAADEIERLRAELSEQCRLLGMSAEREAKHLAQIAALEKERDALKAWKEEVEKQEPAGEVVMFGERLKEVSWRRGKLPEVGTKLYARHVPVQSVPTETIVDYLVSISAHVAHRDDAQAQKELGELLKMLAAAPEVE